MNLLVLLFILISPVFATRKISATSLVTCSDDNSITPSYFNVTFNPDDLSLRYNVDLTTEINGFVIGHLQVFAYGFVIIERDIDLCGLGWKQFCPLYPGSLQIDSIEYISNDTASAIPGIAYQVPDIDATVRIIILDRDTRREISCLQASFTNGKTVSQTGVKWATAVIAGLGLLIAAILSTFGNSNAASNISANAVSLFLYFQSVVVVCMQSVERLPPIASAWAENLAWSMGLIRVQFMQDIFRWYVQSTGGNPTLFFKGTTKQILVQRAYDYLANLHEYVARSNPLVQRALDFNLSSNKNLIILRGIKRIGYNSTIEPTSIVATGFTFFLLIGILLVVVLFIVKQVVDLLIFTKTLNPNSFNHFRKSFGSMIKGSLLRYIYIGFTQIIILSLWEFTQNDSPALIVLGALLLVLVLGVIGWSCYRANIIGKLSIKQFQNPAALLYGDSKVLNKYGFVYTMFNAKKFWFGSVILGYSLIKGIFIGLCQPAAKVSVVVIFVLDLAYTIYLFIKSPYLNKSTNVINYCMSIVNTLNSFLFLFFSNLFGQAAPVASIMGWVFFILNAAFSLILLIFIIVFSVLSVISKNPDARFAPARDDRTSFQRMSSIKRRSQFEINEKLDANELSALGMAAQDHNNNWAEEMYKMSQVSGGSSANNSFSNDILSPELNQEKSTDVEVFGTEQDESHSTDDSETPKAYESKLKTWKRGLSLKRKQKEDNGDLTRLSDNTDEDFIPGHNREESNLSEYMPTGRNDLI